MNALIAASVGITSSVSPFNHESFVDIRMLLGADHCGSILVAVARLHRRLRIEDPNDASENRLACLADKSLGRGAMARTRHMRKKPLQMRSQATVDAIVEAAARVFEASGFAGASTNKIAEIAGVSVGSLYQYFPDKLGLLEVVNERYLVGLWGVVCLACQEALLLPWPEALRHIVTAKVGFHVKGGRLFGVLQSELPANSTSGIQLEIATKNFEVNMRKLLTANQSMIAVDVDRAIHMIPIIGKGVLNASFNSRPEDLKNGRIIDEVTNVLANYLSKPDLSEVPTGAASNSYA